ncbi:MAG: hypothetical protein ACQEQO_09655 [Thermodesulfobacteriota bacterium]
MILGGYIDFPHALRRIYFQFYQYVALIFSEFGMPKHQQLEKVKGIHDEDLSQGYGEVYLPDSLIRKYPHASKEFCWQYIFPSKKRAVDPHTGIERRSHVLESGLQKAVKIAVDRDGITKRVGCQTFRHSFETHLLEDNVNSQWYKSSWTTRM